MAMNAPASTIVFFHAHPDDEVVLTGGSMARAADEGHRVVLIVATNGEHGEVPDDLAEGETIVARRRRETECSAEVLGVHHVLWLGYSDSGMTGWDQNADPASFWQADVDDAAAQPRQAARGRARRRPRHLRLARRLRPSRPRPGASGRPPRRRPRRHATRPRGDVQPRQRCGRSSWTSVNEEWDPDRPADDGNPFGTPGDRDPLRRRRRRLRRAQATGAGVPRQPDERRRGDAGDARGDVRQGVRHRVVHRARPPPGSPRLASPERAARRLDVGGAHRAGDAQLQPLVVPQLGQAWQAPARTIATPHCMHIGASELADHARRRRVVVRHRRGDAGAELVGEVAGRRQRLRVGDHLGTRARLDDRLLDARAASAASARRPRRSTARRAPRRSCTPSPACGTGSPSPRRRSGSPDRRSSRPARSACS